MAKTTHKLTNLLIRGWISNGAPVAKSDGDGLTFTLSTKGTASWVLRYRLPGGRRRELTIGNYPDISLAAARERARAARASIDSGGDPAADKRLEKMRSASAWTMAALVADYRTKVLHTSGYAKSTIEYRERDLQGVILPRLGPLEPKDIAPTDIVDMLKRARKTWTVTKRLLTSTSQVFDHACGLKIIAVNPCVGIRMSSLMGKRPPARKRVMLQTDELRALLPGIDCIGRENALALLILLATCVRGIELAKARKEHLYLDRGAWWVPDENVKTRTGFLVPLAPTVVGWFRELLDYSGESAYILPARQERRLRKFGGDAPVGSTTLWAAIRRAFERGDIDVRKFTPHDTRSTAKGHMRNMGISREISEIALNHALRGMEAIYDVREEIPERREALEMWAAFLSECAGYSEVTAS